MGERQSIIGGKGTNTQLNTVGSCLVGKPKKLQHRSLVLKDDDHWGKRQLVKAEGWIKSQKQGEQAVAGKAGAILC